jgi:hypothetical protein
MEIAPLLNYVAVNDMKIKPQEQTRAQSGGGVLYKRDIVAASAAWGPVGAIEDIAPGLDWLTTSRHGKCRLTSDPVCAVELTKSPS